MHYNLDISQYDYKDDFDVVFMFNPIRREILSTCLSNLCQGNKSFYLCYVRDKADKNY